MKLSELIAEHPEMDVELGDQDDRLFLDGAYLFRVMRPTDGPGEGTFWSRATPHTDGIVYRGLLTAASEISFNNWGEDTD